MYTIRCRAQLDASCLGGKPTKWQFGEDLPLSEDNTYDRETGTIVCDICYVALMPYTDSGRGLLGELDDAIETYKKTHDDA